MNEPAVTLTNFAITFLCVVFVWKLWAYPVEKKSLQHSFIGLFACAGLASLWGGLVHGFLPPEDSFWTTFFWQLTLITVGVSAYNLWLINFQLLFSDRIIKQLRLVMRVLVLLYSLAIIFVTQEFIVAIISYIPPAFILFLLLLMRVIRTPTRFNWAGLVGLLLTFFAAYIQQAEIGIHPVYFNHNVLYHCLQALGLWGLYFFGSRAARWNS